jgi:hypothetical protein
MILRRKIIIDKKKEVEQSRNASYERNKLRARKNSQNYRKRKKQLILEEREKEKQ